MRAHSTNRHCQEIALVCGTCEPCQFPGPTTIGIEMKRLFAALLPLTLASPAFAWNDHSHMVVARLAWNKLTDA
jgi:hypothetical protein